MSRSLRVLSLQPFYGGSHRAFIDGWIKNSRHDWTQITLPDRFWKWRMRHAAIYMAEEIEKRVNNGGSWDTIFTTDMLNVAEFRGIVSPAIRKLPTLVYFHENQLVYPSIQKNERDYHFAFTNLTTTVAADCIWFNSIFNRQTMVQSLRTQSKKWPDFPPNRAIAAIETKSAVQPPGIELTDSKPGYTPADAPIHLLWAARWEHDKNPADLLATLEILESKRLNFRVSLIGQSFNRVPESIRQIEKHFREQIDEWGFIPTRDGYWQALARADVFISTAIHEFFGLSFVEAIAAGTYPLLPDRLSYPEILNVDKFPLRHAHLYDGTPLDLANKIIDLESDRKQLADITELCNHMRQTYAWATRAKKMDDALEMLVAP